MSIVYAARYPDVFHHLPNQAHILHRKIDCGLPYADKRFNRAQIFLENYYTTTTPFGAQHPTLEYSVYRDGTSPSASGSIDGTNKGGGRYIFHFPRNGWGRYIDLKFILKPVPMRTDTTLRPYIEIDYEEVRAY